MVSDDDARDRTPGSAHPPDGYFSSPCRGEDSRPAESTSGDRCRDPGEAAACLPQRWVGRCRGLGTTETSLMSKYWLFHENRSWVHILAASEARAPSRRIASG